jgi:hypothetical protein
MKTIRIVSLFASVLLFAAFAAMLAGPSNADVPTQTTVDYTKKPWPAKAPGATYTTLPKPMLLGETDNGPWGQNDKWGVVKFTHEEHYSKYKFSCQTCHHTNGAGDAAKTEDVQRCVDCHKESGNEKNPLNKETSEEIDVKLAYHGNPDNTTNLAGCATCHKQKGSGPVLSQCSGCHASK